MNRVSTLERELSEAKSVNHNLRMNMTREQTSSTRLKTEFEGLEKELADALEELALTNEKLQDR